MAPTRIGTIDHPERYDARSVSVFESADGALFTKLNGIREKLHGAVRWTKLNGTSMRGRAMHSQQPRASPRDDLSDDSMSDGEEDEEDGEDEEDEQLHAAILASLEEIEASPPEAQPAPAGAGNDVPTAAGGDADSGGRTCSICLTEPAVMLMRPCRHLCACETCSRRLGSRPCVICRRPVQSMERVFF